MSAGSGGKGAQYRPPCTDSPGPSRAVSSAEPGLQPFFAGSERARAPPAATAPPLQVQRSTRCSRECGVTRETGEERPCATRPRRRRKARRHHRDRLRDRPGQPAAQHRAARLRGLQPAIQTQGAVPGFWMLGSSPSMTRESLTGATGMIAEGGRACLKLVRPAARSVIDAYDLDRIPANPVRHDVRRSRNDEFVRAVHPAGPS
jgi:hypothetical protein